MIELKIQASSPDALRDTILAFHSVMASGLIAPNDQVTMTATDAVAEIEAFIDQAPELVLRTEPEPEPEPAPKKRGRPRKAVSAEPVADVEPDPEIITEEEEPEAEGAVEPPAEAATVTPINRPRPPAPGKPIEYTEDDVRDAVKTCMDVRGIPETIARLKQFGAKRAGDVPREKYEDAINALLEL